MRRKQHEWMAGVATVILGSISSQAYSANCTFGSSGEPSLQTVLDGALGAASINVQTSCLADGSDAQWTTVGNTGTVDILIELAGNANANTFGIYDPGNGNKYQIFEGNDGTGDSGTIRLVQSGGNWYVKVKDDHNSGPTDNVDWNIAHQLTSSNFGFYLATNNANGTFYSNTGLNSDGVDHMYAYGPLTGDPNWEGQYVQAWEDLNGGGDRDYQDFVVSLADVVPVSTVPLPAALPLLMSGLGLLGVGGRFGRRRKTG